MNGYERIRACINGKPLDPHHVDAEIVALRAAVRPDLFTGFSVEAFPTTSMTAYALTAAADRTGDPVLGEEVGLAVRHALFEEGLDIGRSEIVAQIADRFGLKALDGEATSAAVEGMKTSSPGTCAITASGLCAWQGPRPGR